ncbi:MAG: hypothetical protein H0W72_09485 [Planctomycetes bacterium]|nr:hypothetical protein [Planctomycetota bacterium]
MQLHPHDLEVLIDHCRSGIVAGRNALAFLNGCWVTNVEPESWMGADAWWVVDANRDLRQLDRALHHLAEYIGTGLHPTDELFAICKSAIFAASAALAAIDRNFATQGEPQAGQVPELWLVDEREALETLHAAFAALEGFGIRAVNEDDTGRFDRDDDS